MNPADLHGNQLIDLLDEDARAAVATTPVQLRTRQILHEPGAPAVYAYFPVTAVISLVSTMESGASTEVALVGREGLVGLAGVFGTVEGPTTAIVQIPGLALRASNVVLKAARLRFASVRKALDLYTEARLIQVAQTAACNRLHAVEERLARWLLTIDDRIDGARFTLSQEFMAQMLGVQRPTVSSSLQRLQDARLISYEGRSMMVADRAGLQRVACECYAVLRREFERLLPVSSGRQRGPESPDSGPVEEREPESAATLETMREIAGRLLIANLREQEAREQVQAANRIAEAQLSIVEDLVEAARLASAVRSVQPSLVTVADVVRDAIDAVKPAADEKTVALRPQIPDGLPPILADADHLRQVLVNVLSNALKLIEAGRSIDLSIEGAAQTIRVVLCDAATGAEALTLGWSIARALVGLHGGSIQITGAEAGRGSTCTIALPASPDAKARRYVSGRS